ncbi:DapH/DapD/GlmU-related protein [uncultured Pseudodesulfovibrio sp.]|uniref:DapH/DapD/GlmU-related protein n=1 Tax=uncultured Pseudodesulfovibrio sp. TaxID=2035858 RepID=UPI0029C6DC0B|nr:DapH/DapD/GlmU-related protein [uncultured Pseudodesulfovibrio sp.]
MELKQLLELFDNGLPIEAGSDAHSLLVHYSNEAMRITAELNNSYQTPEQVRSLMTALTGREVDETFMLFPPFYSDFGKNIRIGKNVFINACCNFQDQGGITIKDGALIGHRVVMATVNHGFAPEKRQLNYPAPIVIGKNVWVGSSATILQGVTIGDDAIVAAGAVVTRDVAPGTIVGGVPARFIKTVDEAENEHQRHFE